VPADPGADADAEPAADAGDGPGVAPDGSPVAAYLRMPPRGEAELIHGAVGAGASVLELGCGPGRVTHRLVALGHPVVAVDNSAEMLSHLRGAEPVLADLYELDLGREFDAIVLGSHLINEPEAARRAALLAVARRHARRGGAVLVQRYDPGWARDAVPSAGYTGDVHVRLHDVVHDGDLLHAAVTYAVDGRSWTQRFTAGIVDDDVLADEAAAADLRLDRWLDDRREWAHLVAGG
jgi:SAM-dependent methyltransferase